MVMAAMNWKTDKPEALPLPPLADKTTAEVPLDYLVNALNRAVLRRQATGTEEIEHRT
jgi:hypothetical protein